MNIMLTSVFSLVGVWLGASLYRSHTKHQFLMETRRMIYAKLLSGVMSEENYPNNPSDRSEENILEYNRQLKEWRRNRRALKGLAAEALLITENGALREKLSEFISSHNPDSHLVGVEEIMRKEIGI